MVMNRTSWFNTSCWYRTCQVMPISGPLYLQFGSIEGTWTARWQTFCTTRNPRGLVMDSPRMGIPRATFFFRSTHALYFYGPNDVVSSPTKPWFLGCLIQQLDGINHQIEGHLIFKHTDISWICVPRPCSRGTWPPRFMAAVAFPWPWWHSAKVPWQGIGSPVGGPLSSEYTKGSTTILR